MDIPQFPAFANIKLEHKKSIEEITKLYPSYSDFNFTSLFCWNTDNSTEVSLVNENLIIKLPDYITGEAVISILGNKNIPQVFNLVSSFSQSFEMVPEITANELNPHEWNISQDIDNFDYLYSNEKLSSLQGGDYKWKRKKRSRFVSRYGDVSKISAINFKDINDINKVAEIFEFWVSQRNREEQDVNPERAALHTLLSNIEAFELTGDFIYVDNQPLGFSINEGLKNNTAICHFHKSVLLYDNVDIYFSSKVAEHLLEAGYSFVNWEQDLGIEGLRHAKQSYHPVSMLKKYKVQKI